MEKWPERIEETLRRFEDDLTELRERLEQLADDPLHWIYEEVQEKANEDQVTFGLENLEGQLRWEIRNVLDELRDLLD
jgi:hypothetical protein